MQVNAETFWKLENEPAEKATDCERTKHKVWIASAQPLCHAVYK